LLGNVFAQSPIIEFRENKGQWHNNVLYKAKIPGGELFLEENELTYLFYKEDDMFRLEQMHHQILKNPTKTDYEFNLHAFKIEFLNAQHNSIKASYPSTANFNYFIGNDPQKWASNVKIYKEVEYLELYPDINLKMYLKDGFLKYDFLVAPHANTKDIKLKYKGVDELFLEDGNLHVKTSVNEIIEQKPYAYQIVNGEEKEVKCKFKLDGDVLKFIFPKGYDHTLELVIDPVLIFASYSGSLSDNWGSTSTFDNAGHLYGAGVTFGPDYPTTAGAYQTTFNGGNGNYAGTDISISKFSPDGSSLIYATYIGGAENESPHSLIVDNNGDLIMLGTTSSSDYPVSVGAYDISFNGGTLYDGAIPNFVSGSDIIISKLNSSGSMLLNSTFVGGSENDGLSTTIALKYNYADDFRGEVLVDDNDNIYVASSTFSSDFPVTTGAFQTTHGGGQDGCVFKLTPDLTTLIWSSYLGGSNDDAAYALQFDSFGNPHITGGTVSNDFPTTTGVLHPDSLGGVDGFITKVNSSATTILNSTYIGTDSAEYDQCYFIQLDTANNVYVVGQTEGEYPIFPLTVHNDSNSGQFLHKLSPDLSTTIFSTTFGTNSGEVDIALSAFLVNECNYILISGWGGYLNNSYGNAVASTTTGLTVSANAIQPSTDGNDYYLIMLGEDADTIMYATFFGGSGSADHVDGGTSRFDKKGIVYQAVCASCGTSNNDFPVTPGAYSLTDNSQNNRCNLGVFKIDLTKLTADAEVYTTPYYCVGDTVHFENRSNGGYKYDWYFDDGDSISAFEPTHIYDTVGTYNVMLVALDSISCVRQDTDYVQVFIAPLTEAIVEPITGICKGDSIELIASGGAEYLWYPNYNINMDSTDTVKVWPETTTTYSVIVTDSCGSDTTEVEVVVHQKNIDISSDTVICIGHSASLSATGGGTYTWSPALTLDNILIENPIATPDTFTIYTVVVTDTNGCIWDTVVTVTVDTLLPIANASADLLLCRGDTVAIYATGDSLSFSWTPTNTVANPVDSITSVFPLITTKYTLAASNWCGVDYDTVEVEVHIKTSTIVDDTLVCVGEQANLWVAGGVSYLWHSDHDSYITTDADFSQYIYNPTTFYVDVEESSGCETVLSVFVDTLPYPIVDLGEDLMGPWSSAFTLNPTIVDGSSYLWLPSDGLSCSDCPNPIVSIKESKSYVLVVQGTNGCIASDTVNIIFDGAIYLPNSFTPNGNGVNDIFYAYGDDIVEFELYIFNRWGEQIFYTNDLTVGWDGTYKGKESPVETYIWKVNYKDATGSTGNLLGTVTLIR